MFFFDTYSKMKHLTKGKSKIRMGYIEIDQTGILN